MPILTGKSSRYCLDDRFRETMRHGTNGLVADSSFAIGETRSGIMAGWRRVIELTITDEEIERLKALSRSRTEPASRVSRAQMLLAYRENPSFCAVGQRVGVHHQTFSAAWSGRWLMGRWRQSRTDHGRAKN